MPDNFIIDITETLSKFKDYFEHSERMILSAKFGDGKSFFLNRFIEDNLKNPKYYFVVLHPVNYVVEENRDIFEYIKRDILFQMLQDGKVFDFEDAFDKLDKAVAENISFCEIFDFLLSVQPFVEAKGVGRFIKSGAEKFKKICESYNDLKNKPYNYVNSFALHKGSLAECDGFTQIIQQAIKLIEEQYKQQTVLIIEDMDRLDPGHLFRILNVLGAQIDNPYFESDRQNVVDRNPNKFGFSKIVLVMDYGTSEHIFHHFYGNDADYEGYMQKFLDVNPFNFSLRTEAQRMLREQIKDKCFVDNNFFSLRLNGMKEIDSSSIFSCISKLSVRRCKQIITEDIDQYIRTSEYAVKVKRTLRVIVFVKLITPAFITLQQIFDSLTDDDTVLKIDIMFPVYRAAVNSEINNYSIQSGSRILRFEYNEVKQKSVEHDLYGYLSTPLKSQRMQEVWKSQEHKLLSCINFAS